MSKFIKILFELIKIMNFSQLLELKNLIFHSNEISELEFTLSIEAHSHRDTKQHCPYCKGANVVKYGLNALKNQRYKCNDCVKYFCNRTNTPMSYSKKSMESWFNYFKLMCETTTIRECASQLNINIATAFQWRHKILNSIMPMLPNKLEGIVEIEEIFFVESFKGNHSKKICFEMNRPPIKRKLTLSQHLNSKKVAVLCCKDRQTNMFTKVSDRCKTRASRILSLLGNKISEGSTLCTNNNLGYIALAKKLNSTLYKMRNSKEIREGKYHIHNASDFANRIKLTIDKKFKGVATKYLNFYLAWLQWLESMVNNKEIVKLMDIISMSLFSNVRLRTYEFRTLRVLS